VLAVTTVGFAPPNIQAAGCNHVGIAAAGAACAPVVDDHVGLTERTHSLGN